jgi:colicin import membrane protein
MKHYTKPSKFASNLKQCVLATIVLGLVGCASTEPDQAAMDQVRAIESQREEAQAAAARAAQEQEQARIARIELEREQQEAARLAEAEAEAEAQAQAQARAREQAEQAAREEAARIAAAEQSRREVLAREQAQQARVAELEAQIEALRVTNASRVAANTKYEETIAAAQALLDALNAEQRKYSNTNAEGELLVPLEKDLLADLEARKSLLKREAEALGQ